MTNFFSKNLYIQGLKKIRISGVAFSLIIILLNAFLPIIGILENNYGLGYARTHELVEYNRIVPFCMLVIVLVPIIAHDMFGFLNERNQSDFYHSIPQKRTCVYVSFTAAILTWAFGTILVSTVVNTLLWGLAVYYTFTFSTVLLGMLPFLVLSVMMAGVMILAMTVTGTRISNFLIAILFFLFVRVMGALCVNALSEITPILNIDYSVFKYFNIEFFLPFALFQGVLDGEAGVFTDAKLQIYSLLVGIFFLVLGGVAYNKRRSESATKSAPNKKLQHIYRIAVTLPFVFLVAFLIMMDGFDEYQIILIILALLVYVLYELITTKKLRNVLKSLPLLIIPVLITGVMVSGLYIARNTINNDTFEAEDVAGFCFIEPYARTYETFNSERIFVSDAEAAEILANALDYTLGKAYYYGNDRYARVFIKLNSGRVMARNIYVPTNDYERLEDILFNSPEYSAAYLELPQPKDVINVSLYGYYSLDQSDREELYESFYEEYNRLSDADKAKVKKPKGQFTSVVELGVSGYYEHQKYHSTYYILFEYMPLTSIMYLEKIAETYAYGYYGDQLENEYKNLKYYADEVEKGNAEYVYGSVNLSKITGTFDNGSTDIYYKGNNPQVVGMLYEIFGLILSDEKAFVYDDPKNVYRFSYNLDVNLRDSSSEKIGVAHREDFYENVIVEEYAEDYSLYYYFNDEIFVNISPATMAKIEAVIQNLYNSDVEQTPNTETVE